MSRHRAARAAAAPDEERLEGDARPAKLQRLEARQAAIAAPPPSGISQLQPLPSDPSASCHSSALAHVAAAAQTAALVSQAAACPLPPPLARFTDHLTGTLHSWPRNADGSTATCAQVAARAMLHCQFIAQSRAFCMRWLQRQRMPAHALALPETACALALPEAACARVRCSELAHVALIMTTSVKYQRLRDRRRGAEAIIARVHVGHCKAVQVRRGAARSRFYSSA
jgi:hypothetical protein